MYYGMLCVTCMTILGAPLGFQGTRKQKKNKAGNTGKKATFREQGKPKS